MNLQLGPALRTGQTAPAQPENGTEGTQQPMLPGPAKVDPHAWRLLAIFVATVIGIIVKPLPNGRDVGRGHCRCHLHPDTDFERSAQRLRQWDSLAGYGGFSIAAGFITRNRGRVVANTRDMVKQAARTASLSR
jgi:hypothetical protein